MSTTTVATFDIVQAKARVKELQSQVAMIEEQYKEINQRDNRTPETKNKQKLYQAASKRHSELLEAWQRRKSYIAKTYLDNGDFIPKLSRWRETDGRVTSMITNIRKPVLENLGKIVNLDYLWDTTVEDLVFDIINKAANLDSDCVRLQKELNEAYTKQESLQLTYDEAYPHPEHELFEKKHALEFEAYDLIRKIEKAEQETVKDKIPEIERMFNLIQT